MDNEQGGVKVKNTERIEEDYIRELKKSAKKRVVWTPMQLAVFILTVDPDHYLDSPIDIKKRFKLKVSPEKIEKLRNSKEYDEVIIRWFLQYARSDERTEQQFQLIKERYWRQQMTGHVTSNAVQFFGELSGKYSPKADTQVNTYVLSNAANKKLGEDVAEALRNRQSRLREGGNGN